jgi:hypothetical protein
MAEATGHFLVVDHPRVGSGFEVALWGHHIGRLFAVAARPTHAEALLAAEAEASTRGIAYEDRTTGAA